MMYGVKVILVLKGICQQEILTEVQIEHIHASVLYVWEKIWEKSLCFSLSNPVLTVNMLSHAGKSCEDILDSVAKL